MRAVSGWLWSVRALRKGTAPAAGVSPSARGRGAMYQLRLPIIRRLSRGTREQRTTALAVTRVEVQHASLLRVRIVPRWLWSVYALVKGIAPATGLSHLARGRGATYQLRPPTIRRLMRGTRQRASALAVSGEEAQHASLLRARAVPRGFCSAWVLDKGSAPARDLFLSARGRGATYQLRPPRIRRLSRGSRERPTALAPSGEEAQHASLLCARAVSRWLWLAQAPGKAQHQREASFLRRAAVM